MLKLLGLGQDDGWVGWKLAAWENAFHARLMVRRVCHEAGTAAARMRAAAAAG